MENQTELEQAYRALQEQYARDMKDKHEYIDMERKRHAEYIEERNEVIKNLKEEINQLHYTVKGACSEHLSLRISVSPEMMASSNERDLAQFMTEKANKQMAHAVEKQLGDRYELNKEYDRAIRHIFYLENHARSRGVSFTEFGMPIRFK